MEFRPCCTIEGCLAFKAVFLSLDQFHKCAILAIFFLFGCLILYMVHLFHKNPYFIIYDLNSLEKYFISEQWSVLKRAKIDLWNISFVENILFDLQDF